MSWVPVTLRCEGGEGCSGLGGSGRGALAGPWLTAVLPQNSLMQELESSQRQIEEQQNHKVPSCLPAGRLATKAPLCWTQPLWFPCTAGPVLFHERLLLHQS